MKKNLTLRALTEGAIFVALAWLIGYLKLFELPQGGSVNLAMLPIFLYCARWGFGPGMLKYGFFTGTAVGALARFLVHWLVGVWVWGEYMPETFFGMTMTTPWFYSFLYNGSFMLIDTVLCLVIGALLWKPMGRYLRGEDLRK